MEKKIAYGQKKFQINFPYTINNTSKYKQEIGIKPNATTVHVISPSKISFIAYFVKRLFSFRAITSI